MKNYKINAKTVRICGKTEETETGILLVNSGTFFEFSGKISRICMKIAGSDGDKYYDAYLAVFINGSKSPKKIWKIKEGIHEYEVFFQEEKEEVTVRIIKLTELQYGTAEIIELDTDGVIMPTKPRKRKMMFVGDSLTAGYGVTGGSDDLIFTTETEDVTKAYSYQTSEALDADAWFVSWSGGGIVSRWIPPEEEEPLTDILIPDLFEKGKDLEFVPQLIAINLGTNDASYTRGNKKREAVFTKKYAAFVKQIAEVYPEAHILMLYGLMETSLIDAVRKTEEQCRQEGIRCSFLKLPLLQEQDGMGTGGHPSFVTHKKTALVLQRAIADILGWKE